MNILTQLNDFHPDIRTWTGKTTLFFLMMFFGGAFFRVDPVWAQPPEETVEEPSFEQPATTPLILNPYGYHYSPPDFSALKIPFELEISYGMARYVGALGDLKPGHAGKIAVRKRYDFLSFGVWYQLFQVDGENMDLAKIIHKGSGGDFRLHAPLQNKAELFIHLGVGRIASKEKQYQCIWGCPTQEDLLMNFSTWAYETGMGLEYRLGKYFRWGITFTYAVRKRDFQAMDFSSLAHNHLLLMTSLTAIFFER